MRVVIRVLVVCLFLSVCLWGQSKAEGNKTPETPKYRELDGGFIGTTYVNHYFGISYSLPDKWISHDQETQARQLEKGHDALQNPELKKTQSDSDHGFFMLVLTSPPDRMVPQIALLAQDVYSVPQIKTGEDFVKLMRDQFAAKEGYRLVGDVRQFPIAGRDFYIGEMFKGEKVHQAVVSTVIKRHAVAFLITAVTDEDFKAMLDNISKTKFVG